MTTDEIWVVTYRVEINGNVSLTEYFRGSKAECKRIAKAFGGFGEDDRFRSRWPWRVIVGDARGWDEFLADQDDL